MKNKNEKISSKLSLMSLFDGAGCFAISWANVNNIPYKKLKYHSSEIEPFLTDMLAANFPNMTQLYDITKIKIEDLKKESIDIITMGTPCPGFSISGKREGLQNAESMLFSNGVEMIGALKPKYFIWENVFGVFTSNERKEFREILDQFKNIGYDVSWTLLDSKFFNVPQRRRRVYVIGVRDGINKSSDVFDFLKRQSPALISRSKLVDDFFVSDLNVDSVRPQDHYAFFNRQRSDKFKSIGLSSTLAKRDYKSVVDIVVKNGELRRIVPKERLLLQSMPSYWFDSGYLINALDKERFRANGMTVNTVDYIYEQLLKMDNNEDLTSLAFKKTIYIAKTSYDVCKGDKWDTNRVSNSSISFSDTDKNGRLLPKIDAIPNSGIMFLDRDKDGNVISDGAEYHIPKKCSESSPEIKLKKIQDCLLSDNDKKFNISENGCAGFLKRERKSGIPLPKKMKEVIFYKYPNLRDLFK